MTAMQTAIEQMVDRRLAAILRAPQMWGSPESIELQALQLIEFLAISHNHDYAHSRSRAIKEQYRAHVRGLYGVELPAYLAQRLSAERDQEAVAQFIAQTVMDFYHKIKHSFEMASDPLNTGDVSLALVMQPGTPRLSQPVVASYYSALPRVIRKIHTPHSRRGKTPKADQVDYVAAAGVEITPPNGIPGRIVMGVDVMSNQLTMKYGDPRERIAEQYARFSDFISIANDESAESITIDKLDAVYRDSEISHRMALAAISMIPTAGQGIEKVVWGGKLLSSAPFALSHRTASTLMPIVQADPHRKAFEEVGIVRQADLDRRRYRMRIGTKMLTFVLNNDVLQNDESTATRILGKKVRVRGFTVHNDSFVDEIEIQDSSTALK